MSMTYVSSYVQFRHRRFGFVSRKRSHMSSVSPLVVSTLPWIPSAWRFWVSARVFWPGRGPHGGGNLWGPHCMGHPDVNIRPTLHSEFPHLIKMPLKGPNIYSHMGTLIDPYQGDICICQTWSILGWWIHNHSLFWIRRPKILSTNWTNNNNNVLFRHLKSLRIYIPRLGGLKIYISILEIYDTI